MNTANNPPRRKSTLRDVAKAAGVSATTVSRVLNKGPNVSDKLLERVKSAMEDLNYTPSPAARALNTGRTYTVGALIPTLDNAIFSKFLDAVEKRLTYHNLNIVISTTNDDPIIEAKHAEDLLNMGAEALIVSGNNRSEDFLRLIELRQIPVVITSHFITDSIYPSIGYDNFAISKIALDHLYERGHKTISVIHGPARMNDRTQARLEGIKADNRFNGIEYFEEELAFGGGCVATKKILRLKKRPTAIFCLSDVLALGAVFELGRNNIAIPDEMAVMGFDNLAWSQYSDPPISTMELSVELMGSKVADQISNYLENGKPIEGEILLGELVVRQST